MPSRIPGPFLLLALLPGLLAGPVPAAATTAAAPTDAYVAGYAAAILEREFNVRAPSLRVAGGVVSVSAADLADADRARVVAALSEIRGAARVEVRETEQAPRPGTEPLPTGALPGGQLFRPLLADPRWPHFSASYQGYLGDRDFANLGAVSFGETFTLYRGDLGRAGQWDVGLQGGVFAVFDLDRESKDLINADYFAAGFLGWRLDSLAALGRLFHQSSHLGDEFLLRTRLDRVNLSYEGVDLKLSYDLPWGFRLYGGGGVIFDQEPEDLDPWSTQVGAEYRSPRTFGRAGLRPVAGVDVQQREENGWRPDVSARAGVQLDSAQVLGRSLQLLLEYFNGHSPHGQFYRREVEYFGVGAHFQF
jgi:hypothetical protein